MPTYLLMRPNVLSAHHQEAPKYIIHSWAAQQDCYILTLALLSKDKPSVTLLKYNF